MLGHELSAPAVTGWWVTLADAVWSLLDEHPLLVAFVLLMLEEMGLPPLIPGDLLMAFIGVQAADGKVSLLQGLVVLEIASILGGSALYWVSTLWGQQVLLRAGWLVRSTPDRLRMAENALVHRSNRAIILGRLIPSLCILTAIVAGVLGIPYRRFLPALAIGSFLHLLIVVVLGYTFGPSILQLVASLHLPLALLAWGILFVGLTSWIVRVVGHVPVGDAPRTSVLTRVHCGLTAGLLAAVEALLIANVLNSLLTSFEGQTSATLALAVESDGRAPLGFFLIGTTALSVLVMTLLGAAYGVVERAFTGPGWLRGIVFTLGMLAGTMAVLVLFAQVRWIGSSLDVVGADTLIELVRVVTYGVTLGLTFPAFVRALAAQVVS